MRFLSFLPAGKFWESTRTAARQYVLPFSFFFLFLVRDINTASVRRRAKYSECPSRILMRRRKNLLRHRMHSNGGNTYKSRGKGCALSPSNGLPRASRIVATCIHTTLMPGPSLPEGLVQKRVFASSAGFKNKPKAHWRRSETVGNKFSRGNECSPSRYMLNVCIYLRGRPVIKCDYVL